MPTALLEELWVENTGATDLGAEDLWQLKNLRLSALENLPALYNLDLRKTNVTDAAMTHLGRFPALRELDLSQTRITDAGLRHLAGLKSLRSLRVGRTPVTDAGIAEFSTTNPQVKLSR